MIVSELKKSILQYAISGKLSEQKASDTSVDKMLESVKDKKKIYKTKLTKYNESIKQDIPFLIPDTWKWVKLKDISLDIYAGGDKPKRFSKSKTDVYNIPVIANGETNDGIVGFTDVATELEQALTVAGRGTIGFSKIRTGPFTPIVRLIVIKLPDEINYKYLQRVFELLIETGVGTSIKQLTVPMIVDKLIPIPPVEEQQRIVDKIDKLFSELDELTPIEKSIKNLKLNFPTDFKTSIIQSACFGKLSVQNNDENANVIIDDIKEISKHNVKTDFKVIPFSIPDNWSWIRFDDLVSFNIGKTPARADSTYWGKDYSWISISDMIDDGYINETKEYISQKAFDAVFKGNISKKGTLIMSFKLTVGKCSILNIDAFHNEGIISIYPKYDSEILKNYLMKILPFMTKYGDTKGAIKGNTLNSKSLKELLIPLPPIEEQKRIVNKIEELLPLLKDMDNIVNS